MARFDGVFAGKRVLVTGHTGFKGSWLSQWLLELGAEVSGFALPPDTQPALFDALALAGRVEHVLGDVRDGDAVSEAFARSRPEIVFHLAAQPLVRRSYAEPLYTLDTNVLGTANVLEAARRGGSVRAVVVITSDKVYRNAESGVPFKEDDPLGGHDPYSASKACEEIVARCYRDSFLSGAGIALATARAGNVIGGGDWALDRIVPDSIRALSHGESIRVRNPGSSRPWQHVLESLSGYLWLAAKLVTDGGAFASEFNFGPELDSCRSVGDLVDRVIAQWGSGSWTHVELDQQPHEAGLLRLDIARAAEVLDWQPVWGFDTAVDRTTSWYRGLLLESCAAADLVASDIESYARDAARAGLRWAAGETR